MSSSDMSGIAVGLKADNAREMDASERAAAIQLNYHPSKCLCFVLSGQSSRAARLWCRALRGGHRRLRRRVSLTLRE